MTTFWPSTHPSSRSPCRNASGRGGLSEGDVKLRKPIRGTFPACCCARAAAGHATAPISALTSRRLVCRDRRIGRGDGGRFTTPPPSRLEARSRLGDKAANELGAPAVSSIPAQLPGPEPASARKGREDDRAVLRWNRRVAGSP